MFTVKSTASFKLAALYRARVTDIFLAAERKVGPVARLGNDEKLGVVGDGETRRFSDEGGGLRNHFRVDVAVHPNICIYVWGTCCL